MLLCYSVKMPRTSVFALVVVRVRHRGRRVKQPSTWRPEYVEVITCVGDEVAEFLVVSIASSYRCTRVRVRRRTRHALSVRTRHA